MIIIDNYYYYYYQNQKHLMPGTIKTKQNNILQDWEISVVYGAGVSVWMGGVSCWELGHCSSVLVA